MAENKRDRLDHLLNDLNSFVVGFSGGVDSSYLLLRAHSLLNKKIMGVTLRTPYMPDSEIKEASEFARSHNISHSIIDLSFPEPIRNNPPDRCYICKKILFGQLISFAADKGFSHVVDGSNADDAKSHRPGIRALKELGIRSPLMEAGLTKQDIRDLLDAEGLTIASKPSMACLLTRIPYNTPVSSGMILMVEQAEDFFRTSGYPGTRVRIHGDLARIECNPANFAKMTQSRDRELIISGLKKIGFRYVSLDLEGYRSGSYDPENNRP
ncbi:MAG: ATP-dependent sacrificial sulfur transferase LarE [Bacteroidales bacterium]|nr:ATP-dependent sacrificial sulfur transferase LarE [Bacteroidales bacterium]